MALAKIRPPKTVEPMVRVGTTWTPQMIRAAEIQADYGDLRYAAELCEWLLGDDRIAPVFHSRVQALLGLEPSFEPSGDKRRSNRAVKALDAQEDWWTGYPESEVNLILTWGLLLGVAPAQHRWTKYEDHGGRVLPLPEFWNPQHLRYDFPTRQWRIKVVTEASPLGAWQEIELVPGGPDWILHTPYGKNRPWSMGLWRCLSRLALLKSYAYDDWARASANGGGILTATATPMAQQGTQQGQRDALANDLSDLIAESARHGVVALPPGFDLKLVSVAANTEQLFHAQIKMANDAITIAVRGGNLSTEVKGGSLAAAESQEKTADEPRLRFDAQSWTTTAHDQSLVWWAEFNYGDRRLAPWPVYPVEEDEDLEKKATAQNLALDVLGKAVTAGFDVDPQGFIDEYGLSKWLKVPAGGKLAPPAPEPPKPGEPGAPGQKPPKPTPESTPSERPN